MSNGNYGKKQSLLKQSQATEHECVRARSRARQVKTVIDFVTEAARQLKMLALLALITTKEAKDYEVTIE